MFSKTKLFWDVFGWICSGSYKFSREIKSGTPRFMVGSHLQPPSQRAPHVEWPTGDQCRTVGPCRRLGLMTPRPKERSVVVFRRELSNFGRLNMWLFCLCFCVMSGWLPYASCRRSQFWGYQSSGHISGPFLLVRCPWPSINIHQHWNFTPWPNQAQTSNLPKAPMSIAPPVQPTARCIERWKAPAARGVDRPCSTLQARLDWQSVWPWLTKTTSEGFLTGGVPVYPLVNQHSYWKWPLK